MDSIWLWQQKFRKQPVIWYVIYNDGEFTGNFYDSKEAAALEIEFHQRQGHKVRICCCNIHDLELSKERWGK